MPTRFDSLYMGDGARHLPIEELEARFAALRPPPRQSGTVGLIVARGERGLRDVPHSALLSIQDGLDGDSWRRSITADPDAQLTVMEMDVATLIANEQSLTIYGDQLFVDLDLSRANLPIGSTLRIGTATLQVSPRPHKGCAKFMARFGADALRFVSRPDRIDRNLRGVYFRVTGEGSVRVGDEVEVVRRAT